MVWAESDPEESVTYAVGEGGSEGAAQAETARKAARKRSSRNLTGGAGYGVAGAGVAAEPEKLKFTSGATSEPCLAAK